MWNLSFKNSPCFGITCDLEGNIMKQALKIKLKSHAQFLEAWKLFIKLGYHCDNKPHTCPYLYADKEGALTYDFFDVEGSDGALQYFNDHTNQEVTLVELQSMVNLQKFWSKAPVDAWVWERLPNGKCVWHCRKEGKSFDKKAPNYETERNTLWRSSDKQKEANQMNASINTQLSKLNIVLA